MALEGTADVDEESVVVDELPADDEWGRSVHVGMLVVALCLPRQENQLLL